MALRGWCLFGMMASALVLGCTEGSPEEPLAPEGGEEDVATAQQPLEVTEEGASYLGSQTGSSAVCNTVFPMLVVHPTGGAKYPVFIATPGTGMPYNLGAAADLARTMAARGFVAASVAYANGSGDEFGCGGVYQNKARCIYSADLSSRAIRKLCSHPNADCTRGIVTSGVSQGGVMAILAANYDGRVRATVARSVGVKVFETDGACLQAGSTALPEDRLRVINGEMDTLFANTWMQAPANPWVMNAITGRACTLSTYNCLTGANGSGWRRVANWEVQDGYPGHCYFLNSPAADPNDCVSGTYDTGYTTPWVDWSRDANLLWLQSFTN